MRSMNSQEIADAEKSHSRLVKMSNRERAKKILPVLLACLPAFSESSTVILLVIIMIKIKDNRLRRKFFKSL